MTKVEKKALEQKQKILIRRYKKYEAMQRDLGFDSDFYGYAGRQMQRLDDEAEYIRGLIEERWDE